MIDQDYDKIKYDPAEFCKRAVKAVEDGTWKKSGWMIV